ncbi:MAG TPA: hypothetical protein VNZ55_00660 [Thermomicrobiales bacterium]|nr:hypothetical protein [Thermomicrobiales bacterium]
MELELSPVRETAAPRIDTNRLWPITGALAGLFGFGATILTDIHVATDRRDELTSMANVGEINQRAAHLSIVLGFTCVVLLLAFAAYWRSVVEPKTPRSIASRIVTQGLTAAAGALSLGYGWKGASAIYHANGMDHGTYDDMGLYIYYILNDFGSYIGWFSVTVAAGAVVWMSLRERSIPIWIGIFSCIPVLAVLAWTVLTGLPGFPGVVSPIWMAVACTGLAIHGTFVRDEQEFR